MTTTLPCGLLSPYRDYGLVANRDIDVVLECAVLAPSVHNTQPWRFETDGDTVVIRADRDRQLGYLDPSARQLHLSCGAAIELGYLAARAVGRRCDVELLPDNGNPDVLARLTLGDAQPPTAEEVALADAIAIRSTDRGPYSDRPVPPDVVTDASRRAGELGVWVRDLSSPEDRGAVIAVLSAAEQTEASDPRYVEELARWTDSGQADQGIPAEATADQFPADRVSDVPLRDFTGADRHRHPGGDPEAMPPTVERDLLLLIGTEHDDALSWLRAGRALGWLLLRAAAAGVSAQPLGQAIDLPHGRDRLRRDLGVLGHPQFVLRLGYGSGRPRTRRRIDFTRSSPA
jgi:nitroreductase